MRRERDNRGGGRSGGRSGGWGSRDRDSRRGGGGRSSRGGGGNRSPRGDGRRSFRGGRQSAESGNQRERIAVESGFLVLIDQFMLANPQFIQGLQTVMDEDASKKDELIRDYGGCVIEVSPDKYRIERDPYAYSIVVHPEGQLPGAEEISKRAVDSNGNVFVGTRCLAMIDRELLDDTTLLEKYRQLWFSGQDKACRDLIRDNGGAVRYGFGRFGDDLKVFSIPGEDVIAMWPESREPAEEGMNEEEAGEFNR